MDLAAGYEPADWPEWFVAGELYRITGDLAVDPQTPAAILNDTSTGRQYLLRPDATSELEISGPGHGLLAWLLGRDERRRPVGRPGRAAALPIPSYG